MTVPDFQSLLVPLLVALRDGQERHIRDVIQLVADQLELSKLVIREYWCRGMDVSTSGPAALVYRIYPAIAHLTLASLRWSTDRHHFFEAQRLALPNFVFAEDGGHRRLKPVHQPVRDEGCTGRSSGRGRYCDWFCLAAIVHAEG